MPVTQGCRAARCPAHIPDSAAIAAHGGVIRGEDGAPDPDWHAHVSAKADADAGILHNLRDRIALEAEERRADLRVRVLDEEGVGLYVLAKHQETDEAALHATVDAVLDEVPAGWTVHRNGNNAAIMPPWLGKQHAVAALLPRLRAAHPDAPVIGIGDSLTDAPYMALCDYAMMPRSSQLARAALEPLL